MEAPSKFKDLPYVAIEGPSAVAFRSSNDVLANLAVYGGLVIRLPLLTWMAPT